MDQQEVAVIKYKVKTIPFYSLLAFRREHKNEGLVLVSVTKNEDIWYALVYYFNELLPVLKDKRDETTLVRNVKKSIIIYSNSVNWILIKGSLTNEEILLLRASYNKCDTSSDKSLMEGYNLTLQNKHCFKCFTEDSGARLICVALSHSFPLREQTAIVQH